MKKIIIFMHIPKTAGVTLLSIIGKQYLSDEIGWYYFTDFLQLLNEIEKLPDNPKIKIVCGHFTFGIEKFFKVPITLMTMLRDPIERVISLYYFWRKIPGHPIYEQIMKMSLEDFVTSEEFDIHISNFQTYAFTDEFPANNNSLEKAKKIIERHFSVVGITEMFNESVFLMKKEYGWQDLFYKRENVTQRPNDPISKKVLNIIKEKNKFDIELYNWAKQNLVKTIIHLNEIEKMELMNFIHNQDV